MFRVIFQLSPASSSDGGFSAPWELGTQTPDGGRLSPKEHKCPLHISLPLSSQCSFCFEGAGGEERRYSPVGEEAADDASYHGPSHVDGLA